MARSGLQHILDRGPRRRGRPALPQAERYPDVHANLNEPGDIYSAYVERYGVLVPVVDAMPRARSIGNLAYLVSVNSGGFVGSSRPRSGYARRSQIYGFRGELLACIPESGESVISTWVDGERLRDARTAIGHSGYSDNTLVQLRADLFAPEYAEAGRYPSNAFAGRVLEDPQECREIASKPVAVLVDKGVLVAPAASMSSSGAD